MKRELVPPADKIAEVFAFLAQAAVGDHGDACSLCEFCQTSEAADEWRSEFSRDVGEEHEKLRGLRPCTAEYYFIKELSLLENYAVEYHSAKNSAGNLLNIGVGSEELKIYDSDLNFLER